MSVLSNRSWRVAITIAGSDSGGGAGIEADLKTFASLGVHGTVAITSVTAQNTYEVTAIHDIPPEVVYEQVKVVAEDMGIDAGKTGMLSNSNIIRFVARAVKEFSFPLVVDPVMVAKSGARLLREDAVEALKRELLPQAKVVTPNKAEAEVLSGIEIKNLEDSKLAAKKIYEEYSCEAVVVKGGHLGGSEAVDTLYWDGKYYVLSAPRISGVGTHGTGCVFSAAIAAYLAKGLSILDAVTKAKEFVTRAIEFGVPVGKGHSPVNPVAWLEIPAQKYSTLLSIEEALEKLLRNSEKVREAVPEVGMNLVESIPAHYVRNPNDVAGIMGRIVRYGSSIKAVGPVRFGASSHLARLVIEVLKRNPDVRAAINLRYDEKYVKKATELGYLVVRVDRLKEPEESKKVEGSSLKWIVGEALKQYGEKVPDIIYDTGDVGKEAMIRILGKNATEVVEKLLRILGEPKEGK
ncbi:MAG: bifunctional hydroxymethylpyrimidine kinase/phosphomethylpyrimidine kinase [Desulfurococcaceae archaeon TW002]